jgi:hypothetical protein
VNSDASYYLSNIAIPFLNLLKEVLRPSQLSGVWFGAKPVTSPLRSLNS